MARGALAEDGAYSRAVLKRFLFHQSSLKDKHFLDTLLPRVRRNDLYSLEFQHEVFESKTAVLHGYKVGHGDVCWMQSHVCSSHVWGFDIVFCSWQKSWSCSKTLVCGQSRRDGMLAANAVGPSPTCWSWDGDIVTCLVWSCKSEANRNVKSLSIVLLAFMFTLGKYTLNINDGSTVFDLLFIYLQHRSILAFTSIERGRNVCAN